MVLSWQVESSLVAYFWRFSDRDASGIQIVFRFLGVAVCVSSPPNAGLEVLIGACFTLEVGSGGHSVSVQDCAREGPGALSLIVAEGISRRLRD